MSATFVRWQVFWPQDLLYVPFFKDMVTNFVEVRCLQISEVARCCIDLPLIQTNIEKYMVIKDEDTHENLAFAAFDHPACDLYLSYQIQVILQHQNTVALERHFGAEVSSRHQLYLELLDKLDSFTPFRLTRETVWDAHEW